MASDVNYSCAVVLSFFSIYCILFRRFIDVLCNTCLSVYECYFYFQIVLMCFYYGVTL